MAVLDHLEPKAVFRFFEQLCAIPHGSGNTKAVSDWCVDFARQRGLEHYQDEWNNVTIIKPASAGYETAPAVIVQGHLDMVCEKTPDCAKDMTKEGLDLVVDGDFVRAVGTTLGGDDGIAVAMALAILDDDSIPHPRLEVVLTTEELKTVISGIFIALQQIFLIHCKVLQPHCILQDRALRQGCDHLTGEHGLKPYHPALLVHLDDLRMGSRQNIGTRALIAAQQLRLFAPHHIGIFQTVPLRLNAAHKNKGNLRNLLQTAPIKRLI